MDTNFANPVPSDVIDFLRAVKKGELKKVKEFLKLGKFNSTMLVPGRTIATRTINLYGTMKTSMVSLR